MDALIDNLEHDDPSVRKQAALELWLLGEKGRPALAAMKKALDDSFRDVRFYAAAVVVRFAPGEAKHVMPLLVEALQSTEELWFQEMAAAALMQVGREASSAVPALIASLDVPLRAEADDVEREAVLRLYLMSAYALGNIGEMATPAVTKLTELLSRPDAAAGSETMAVVRENAAEALGKIGTLAEAALPELRRVAASDTNAQARVKAAAALARIE